MKLRIIRFVLLLAGWTCAASATNADTNQAAATHEEFFERSVRPVLVERCFKCHGAKKQEAGLRLDSREAVLRGSEEGAVAKAGDPQASKLVRAIRYDDNDLQMPPDGRLAAEEIAALEQWIRLGLPWPAAAAVTGRVDVAAARDHWAFQPIRNPPLPTVTDENWSRTDIDRFVLAALDNAGLVPAARTDRRTLIRRATFDLIGLPPTPEEIAAFESDDTPQAFEKVVDRLLESPHYGERWGRYWLDVARYADNKGYLDLGTKNYPWAFTYRDYVIRAFNEDLPFDQFVLEQLAADQMVSGEDRRALAAMGFLTVGPRFDNNVHEVMDDRIDVVTRGLLGLTVSCARCHDHKYDPIPQADYYSLYGVFRSSVEPAAPPLLDRPPDTADYRDYAAELAKRERAVREFVDTKHAEIVKQAKERTADHLMVAYERRDHPPTENFLFLIPTGDLHPQVTHRWQAFLRRTKQRPDPAWQPWHWFAELPAADFAARAPDVVAQLDAADAERPINPLVQRAFAKPPKSMRDVAERYAALLEEIDQRWQAERKAATDAKRPPPRRAADDAEEQLRRALYGPNAPPMLPKTMGTEFYAVIRDEPTQGEFGELLRALESWTAEGPPRAMALEDGELPYEPYVFVRGNADVAGEIVPRQFLKVLAPPARQPFRQGSGRLELARAVVDPANPLTARVMVNRIWLQHFGSGLVQTPSDFGLRSEPPSHPELLDHLATTFINDGWSIKRLHRRIMLSAVYQQASNDRSECLQVDPENRLLWKMNRQRLDFESLRDSLLAAGAALDETVGGRPVPLFDTYRKKPESEDEQHVEEAEEKSAEVRLKELRAELVEAREVGNDAEVREIQELIKRIEARIDEEPPPVEQPRIAGLKRELEAARAAGNDAEVREIQELLARLNKDGGKVGEDRDNARRAKRIEQLRKELRQARRMNNKVEEQEILQLLARLGAKPEGEPTGEENADKGNRAANDRKAPDKLRRTVYGFVDRMNLPELYRAFDFPSPDTSSPQRDLTTVPPQALYLMNSPFVRDMARRIVERPDVASLPDDDARLDRIHELLFGRQPTSDELDSAREFLKTDTERAWIDLVHALLMTNEFAFVD